MCCVHVCMCGEPYVDEMCVVVALMMIRWHLDSERVNADLRVERLCVLLLLGAPRAVEGGREGILPVQYHWQAKLLGVRVTTRNS